MSRYRILMRAGFWMIFGLMGLIFWLSDSQFPSGKNVHILHAITISWLSGLATGMMTEYAIQLRPSASVEGEKRQK